MAYYGAIPFGFKMTRRRKKAKKASSRKRRSRKRSSAKRGGRKKKLKFGSRAYRRKYLGHA